MTTTAEALAAEIDRQTTATPARLTRQRDIDAALEIIDATTAAGRAALDGMSAALEAVSAKRTPGVAALLDDATTIYGDAWNALCDALTALESERRWVANTRAREQYARRVPAATRALLALNID